MYQHLNLNTVTILMKKVHQGLTIRRFLHPKKSKDGPSSAPSSFSAILSCRNPLKGASPVPGPTITIGTEGLDGSLKLDARINIGAPLHSLLFSAGTAF